MFWTTKRTTTGQWEVMVWAAIVFFVLAGGAGLYLSSQFPADKPVVEHIRSLSFSLWGLAAVVFVAKRVIVYFTE